MIPLTLKNFKRVNLHKKHARKIFLQKSSLYTVSINNICTYLSSEESSVRFFKSNLLQNEGVYRRDPYAKGPILLNTDCINQMLV
jgi:hypothetical protein